MTTKEKLELLWKYLALTAATVLGFLFIGTNHLSSNDKNKEYIFVGDEDFQNEPETMKVKVEKEILNGDTLMKVEVNGKELSSEDYITKNNKVEWKSNDGKLMIIDIDNNINEASKGGNIEKVLKKKIIIKEDSQFLNYAKKTGSSKVVGIRITHKKTIFYIPNPPTIKSKQSTPRKVFEKKVQSFLFGDGQIPLIHA